MATRSYLMDNVREAERLELKTDEAETRAQLALVGLQRGMHALDAGAGSGAVARTMAQEVGPSGRVVALDGSNERLEAGRHLAQEAGLNVEFVCGDLLKPPFPPASFDFVWSRFTFEYLSNPDA